MCYARTAAAHINAYCRMKWPDKLGRSKASELANWDTIDAYDHEGGGSHKYIDADWLTEKLGMEKGAGVFGYWLMKDGSVLLRTCRGPLAWVGPFVEGKEREISWGEFAE